MKLSISIRPFVLRSEIEARPDEHLSQIIEHGVVPDPGEPLSRIIGGPSRGIIADIAVGRVDIVGNAVDEVFLIMRISLSLQSFRRLRACIQMQRDKNNIRDFAIILALSKYIILLIPPKD